MRHVLMLTIDIAGIIFFVLLAVVSLVLIWLLLTSLFDSMKRREVERKMSAEKKQLAYELFNQRIITDQQLKGFAARGIEQMEKTINGHPFNMEGRLDDSGESDRPS